MNPKNKKYEYIGKLIDKMMSLRKKAKEKGQILLITETASIDLFIITNEENVGLIGVSKHGDIDTYKVDVKKWIWAEQEGFKPHEILSKLLSDILLICSHEEFEKHIIFLNKHPLP